MEELWQVSATGRKAVWIREGVTTVGQRRNVFKVLAGVLLLADLTTYAQSYDGPNLGPNRITQGQIEGGPM